MDRDARAELSAHVFGLMAQLVHRTGQDAGAVLRAEGLNPARFQLLLAVAQREGDPQRRFGERLGVTAAAVSMLVTKLADDGLVRREADGAANRLWLSDAGRALVDRLRPDQAAFMAGRFALLEDAELAELQRLLTRAREGLPPPA